MTVDARPVTPRPHPSHTAEKTEGTSSLLADDAPSELPGDPDDLEPPGDFELQTDFELHSDRPEEVPYEDDFEGQREEPEVEDTPGDDALIALARIDRFNDAHNVSAPVDIGPFLEDDNEDDSNNNEK